MRSLLPALLLLALPAGVSAIEEPDFEVVETHEGFELRRYESYLVAETVVDGDFDDAGNSGFRVLADYIFGNNRARAEIDMTAPVTQRESARMEMTAPVLQAAEADRHVIAFVMPAEFTLESLPEPVNEAIRVREVPARLVAALRYSGLWSEERFRDRVGRLRAGLAAAGLRPVAEPEYARYDPPFMPWFLRRNEVLIEVERTD